MDNVQDCLGDLFITEGMPNFVRSSVLALAHPTEEKTVDIPHVDSCGALGLICFRLALILVGNADRKGVGGHGSSRVMA